MKQSTSLVLVVLVFWGAHFAKAQQDGDADVVSTDSPDVDEQNGIDEFSGVTAGRMYGGITAISPNRLYGALITLYNASTQIALAGAIISNTEVLTSASAVLRLTNITKGIVYVTNAESYIDKREIAVKSYAIHSGFNSTSLANDLVILTINGTFAGRNVQPIAISATEIAVSTTNRPICDATGYSVNVFDTIDGTFSQIQYELMTDPECAATGANPSTIMCAKPINGFGCDTDGGAPLLCNGQLYGILTDQSPCAEEGSLPPYQNFTKLPIIRFPLENPAFALLINTTLPTLPRKNYVSCP